MIASAVVQFSVLDYFCFAIVFIVSLSIGIHYAILARKRGSNIEDYLLGGRNMKLVPVSFSLVATAVSGATVVGHITETYAYGLTMWMFIVIAMIRLVVIQYIFLPVFYELQLLSSFSYLEQRFDRTVKKIASAMYLVAGIIFMPIVIYVPALAFQRVSGLNLYVIAATITVLCIVYTAIGGIKAVVWTDVFQLVLILTSSIVIMIVGFNNVGGMRNVWEALDRGGRLVFVKLDLDLEERGTIWGYLFSLIFASIYHMGLSQSSIQRYTALPTLQKAKQSLWIQFGVYMIIILTDLAIGSIMYAAYEDCDPFSAGLIAKIDQTLPHFVQERASLFPGFNGIFIAGIFAAGLSTISTYLNTMSGTIYNDFLALKLKNATQDRINTVMKLLVVILGLLSVLLILAIEHMGTIFTLTFQCVTITGVAIFGLFILGILFPRANCKGAKIGVLIAISVLAILMIGNNLYKHSDPFLPMRTDGCLRNESSVDRSSVVNQRSNIPWIFRINFQYFALIGLSFNIGFGYFFSILTGGGEVHDQRLLATFLRKKVRQDPLLSRSETTAF